jgi:hypothetical protein
LKQERSDVGISPCHDDCHPDPFSRSRDANVPGCVLADLQMSETNGLDLQSTLARNPLKISSTPHGDHDETRRDAGGGHLHDVRDDLAQRGGSRYARRRV